MEIYCGLCGEKAHQLFTHIRTVHEMKTPKYRERSPDAPLVSEELARYLADRQVVPTEQGLRKRLELFDVEFLADIMPGSLVPHYAARFWLPKVKRAS